MVIEITNSCKDQIVKLITKIDTETIIKYMIIKHQEILHINDDIISVINRIITERLENDTRVVVYPNLEDIFKKEFIRINRERQNILYTHVVLRVDIRHVFRRTNRCVSSYNAGRCIWTTTTTFIFLLYLI
jgi:hypothetical protein